MAACPPEAQCCWPRRERGRCVSVIISVYVAPHGFILLMRGPGAATLVPPYPQNQPAKNHHQSDPDIGSHHFNTIPLIIAQAWNRCTCPPRGCGLSESAAGQFNGRESVESRSLNSACGKLLNAPLCRPSSDGAFLSLDCSFSPGTDLIPFVQFGD